MKNGTLFLASQVKQQIAQNVLIGLSLVAAYIAQGFLLAKAVNATTNAPINQTAFSFLIGILVIVFIRAALLYYSEIATQRTAYAIKSKLRKSLLEHLFKLGPAYATARRTGDIQTTIVDGVESLEAYFSGFVPAVIVGIFGPLAVIAVIAWYDWLSALLLITFVALTPILNLLWTTWRMPRSKGIFVAMADMKSFLLDSLQGITTLKAFNAAERRHSELVVKARALRKESMNLLNINLMRYGVTTLTSLGGSAIVLIVGAWRISTGELEPIDLFLLLFLSREAFRPIEKLEQQFHAAWSGLEAIKPVMNFLDETPSIVSGSYQPANSFKPEKLEFESVSFQYPEGDVPAVTDISFTAKQNDVIALVGPSGSGKSTIYSLLLRFYDPAKGRIALDGVNIQELPLSILRDQIAAVAQDTHLFPGTIADNLLIAKPDARWEEVLAAARAANAHNFIMQMPNQYKTELGERGASLSGGQRQRLALARALLKNAPILVLDEATSSIDPESEKLIQEALETSYAGRITIIIAHRLSTIRNATKILVLNEGKIVEEGAHDGLTKLGGLYSKLISAQKVSA